MEPSHAYSLHIESAYSELTRSVDLAPGGLLIQSTSSDRFSRGPAGVFWSAPRSGTGVG